MIVAVIDGMGGGIGNQIVSHLRQEISTSLEVIVLGTNAIATGNMMKAKANRGATGESAIKFSVREADVIIGPLTIVIPNSMMGEITVAVADAISSARAYKILLPITPNQMDLIGVETRPLFLSIKDAIDKLKEKVRKEK